MTWNYITLVCVATKRLVEATSSLSITRIPERYRSALAKIRSLSDESIAELASALERSPAVASFKRFSSDVVSEVKSLKPAEIQDIVQTLYSLYLSRADADTPMQKFASELCDAMRAAGREDLKLSGDDEGKFKDRLGKLLNISSLSVASKALNLKSDHANIYCDAKILTDVRPVFAKPDERPIGAVINHMLKIEYHETGQHKEFFVALDGEELAKLRKVLERAESKSASVKELLKSSGLPDLDFSRENK